MRKRLARVHLVDDLPSIEGLVRSYRSGLSGEHYVIELAKVLHGTDQTEALEGRRVLVPRERVAFIQELK